MTIEQHIANLLHVLLKERHGQDLSPELIKSKLESPKDASHGDIAFPCFLLAKALKSAPPKIASDLAPELNESLKNDTSLDKVEAVGPYLNFFFSLNHLVQIIPAIISGDVCQNMPETKTRVMIEYSQPNTHKAFHVGHMRNVALGDALARMYRHCGYEVVAANYIGDEGTHIAKCLWVYLNHRDDEPPATHKGEYLGSLYRKADVLLDFKNLSKYPFPGVITAKVINITPHPQQDQWKVAIIFDGEKEQQVVCGGQGFQVDDVVAYTPVGITFSGRKVDIKNMKGTPSHGAILSEKELGIGEDKNKIKVFPKTSPGQLLSELGRIKDVLPNEVSVEQEMQKRQLEVSEVLKQLEDKNSPLQDLWQETKSWSMEDFKEVYDWIGCHFDHYFFESEVGNEGKDMVLHAHKKGLLVESEGAIGADLKKDKLGFFLLLKSDGTGLYSTKDIALAKRKFEQFKIDKSIYVVDFSQSLHFSQVFKTLEKLGFPQAKQCFHLAYGLVTLPEGKMSTRKGTVIPFSQLRSTLTTYIQNEFLKKHEDHWSQEEINTAAKNIAVATIRYGMLNQDNLKNIVFDMKEWTSLTGNTGPYLLYAYARTRSIEREIGSHSSSEQLQLLSSSYERELLCLLNQFKPTISRSTEQNKPQTLCIYLYDLAKTFSRMYEHCPVKKAENEELKLARLALVQATGHTLKKGLELIGISTLDRM